MSEAPTRCIECGGTVGQLNEDDDGVPCPACAERLLETLPGVFHAPWAEPAPAAQESDGSEPGSEQGAGEVGRPPESSEG